MTLVAKGDWWNEDRSVSLMNILAVREWAGTMQIPNNPNNDDIRVALIELREELEEKLEEKFSVLNGKVEKLDYKFDTYQKGTDGMVRMATTIIIATATVVVLSSLSPAITAIITALSTSNAG